MSRRAGAEGILRNQRLRACLEGDPENGSRSDADSAVLDGVDRRCRFDLREGHDLERLLWPGTGSGGSTGLLEILPSRASILRRTTSLNQRRWASSSKADHQALTSKMIVRRRVRNPEQERHRFRLATLVDPPRPLR